MDGLHDAPGGHRLPLVLMFPGQGSQYFQMGKPLYDAHRVFRTHMDDMNAFCRDALGVDVLGKIYDPLRQRSDPFEPCAEGGMAIFMMEFALARALESEGIHADFTLGASLGTFAAAAVAGAIAPHDALTAILRQAQVVDRYCPRGGMIAVIADLACYEAPELRDRSVLAAVNYAGHFAIAALEPDMRSIVAYLVANGIPHARVPVNHAFHSSWIDAARDPWQDCLAGVALTPLRKPLVCCAEARVVHDTSPAFYWSAVRHPIRFGETVRALMAQGDYRFVDAGPSGTLAAFMRFIVPPGSASRVQKVLSPFDNDTRGFQAAISG